MRSAAPARKTKPARKLQLEDTSCNTSPIVGPRTSAQLTGELRALELTLDEAVLKKIDAIWPGPGGEAPLAYAW